MFEGPILRNHFNLIALSVTSYDFRTYVNAKNTCINYFSVNTNKCFQIENLYVIVIIKNMKRICYYYVQNCNILIDFPLNHLLTV